VATDEMALAVALALVALALVAVLALAVDPLLDWHRFQVQLSTCPHLQPQVPTGHLDELGR